MVVISSGFHKTHLTTAAGEASRRGLLTLAITAAYPTDRTVRALRQLHLADKGRVARVLERGEEIPEARLRALFLPEVLDELVRVMARMLPIDRLHARLTAGTWRLYGWLAARALGQADGARIYLFRAGFGGVSIDRARALGLITLCDHALAHPSLIEELIENRGRVRTDPEGAAAAQPRDRLLQVILDDLNRSDAVLVNSEFVKGNFIALGWPEERIHVVGLGVDDNFLAGAEPPLREPTVGRLKLLFAGRLERRKGADVLVEALAQLGERVDWELRVAGPVAPDIASDHDTFLQGERVKLLGSLTRPALRREMLRAPIFVLPSYAEGSARVVFEALACGCYVITTPNSGTIVEEGIHGALVPPWDSARLAAAIEAAEDDRARLAEIGTRNAVLVAERFRQVDYGNDLAGVYEKLVAR